MISIYSCANQIPLTGGPKDELAPSLDTALSTPNNQIRFEKKKITFVFDEFIDLQDPAKQVIVTPPLIYQPTISERLKTLTFEFDEKEILKEDATYVINFGEAVVDFTEANKVENFTLVFSTGDYIDSLSISGNVIDAKTREPSEEYLVMLYETVYDSIVYLEKPFYFARTDESGNFQINNLRADTFKLFILNDQNLNYTYDIGEQIGFLDSLIYLTDSSDIILSLESFLENTFPRYIGYESINKGLLRLEFDRSIDPDSINLLNSDSIRYEITQHTPTTYDIWYYPDNLTKLNVLYNYDTISCRINLRSAEPLENQISLILDKSLGDIGLYPNGSFKIKSDYPIQSIDTGFIYITDTLSSQQVSYDIVIDSADNRYVIISPTVESGQLIELTMLPNSLIDLWGNTVDTSVNYFSIADIEDFGTIKLSFGQYSAHAGSYYAELLLDNKETIASHFITSDTLITVSKLVPGDYSLQLIEDLNQNGVWDPGDYLKKLQSEVFYSLPLDKVKGNWIIEKSIDLSNLKQSNEDTQGTESE